VGFGNIQPSLIRKSDGTIVAMMRENGPRQRIRNASSSDEGMTWSAVTRWISPIPARAWKRSGWRTANGY
jgi:hypothetical protein